MTNFIAGLFVFLNIAYCFLPAAGFFLLMLRRRMLREGSRKSSPNMGKRTLEDHLGILNEVYLLAL
jgi:hypothetical protein